MFYEDTIGRLQQPFVGLCGYDSEPKHLNGADGINYEK